MGYGQLSERDALELSRIMEGFPTRSRAAYSRMLLVCWANLYYPANQTPYFMLGRRELGKRCGVGDKTAGRFLHALHSAGDLLELGTRRTKTGEYIKRTFVWLVSESGANDPTMKRPHPANDPTPRRSGGETTPPVGLVGGINDSISKAEMQIGGAIAPPYKVGASAQKKDRYDETGRVLMPWE